MTVWALLKRAPWGHLTESSESHEVQGNACPRSRRGELSRRGGLPLLILAIAATCLPLRSLVVATKKPQFDLSGTSWLLRGVGKFKGQRFRQQELVGRTNQTFEHLLVCEFRADGSFILEDGDGDFVAEGQWTRRGKKKVLFDLALPSVSARSSGPGSILGGIPHSSGVGEVDVQSWSIVGKLKTDKHGKTTLTCVSKFKLRLEGDYLSFVLSGKAKTRGTRVDASNDPDAVPLPEPSDERTTHETAIVYLRDGYAIVTLDVELPTSDQGVESVWVKTSGPRGDLIDFGHTPLAEVTVVNEGLYLYELRLRYPDGSESLAARTAIEVRDPVSARLSWSPPRQNEDGSSLRNLVGFRVYHGRCAALGLCHDDAHRTLLDVIEVRGQSSLIIRGLEAGETYFFFVTSYNSAGVESDPSTTVFKTVP